MFWEDITIISSLIDIHLLDPYEYSRTYSWIILTYFAGLADRP